MTKTKLRTHVFEHDATVPPDHEGRRFCRCGAREDHERHDVPQTSPEARAEEQRRIGEQP